MKIKIFGFEVEVSEGFTLDEFFSGFDGASISDADHILAVKKQSGFWLGIFLTIKDQKAYCRIKREQARFTLVPEKLGDDRIADFNYFIFNAETHRGLYQWYHQSGGVSSFCSFLKAFYIKKRDEKKDKALKALTTEKERLLEAKKYRKSLHYSILCRADSIESRIKSLERVKNMEVSYSTYEPAKSDPMAPMQPYVKRRAEIVSFKKGATGVVKAVASFAKHFTGERLKVEGVDPDGHEQTYKLLNDHDVFEEFDYDTVLENISLDSKDLSADLKEAELVKRMLTIADGKAKVLLSRRRSNG